MKVVLNSSHTKCSYLVNWLYLCELEISDKFYTVLGYG